MCIHFYPQEYNNLIRKQLIHLLFAVFVGDCDWFFFVCLCVILSVFTCVCLLRLSRYISVQIPFELGITSITINFVNFYLLRVSQT